MELFAHQKKYGRLRSRKETSFVRQLFRGAVRLVIFACAVGLVFFVTRLSYFTISEVHVEGGDTVSTEYVKSRAEEELRGSYLLVIPKRFSYLYPAESMRASILSIAKIKKVEIIPSSRKKLDIIFQEYLPHALGCREGSGECWFMDSEGYAFLKAPQLHGGGLVRHYFVKAEDIQEGQILPSDRLHALDMFMKGVADEFGFRVRSVIHKENGDIEFHIHGGGMILASGSKDFAATFDNLRTVLRAPEFEHIETGNFNYIDVRFENKIFVNEEFPTVATSTATTTPLSE